MRLVTSVSCGYAGLLALIQGFKTRYLHRAYGNRQVHAKTRTLGNTTCKTCKTLCWPTPAFKFRVFAPLASPSIPQAKFLKFKFSKLQHGRSVLPQVVCRRDS